MTRAAGLLVLLLVLLAPTQAARAISYTVQVVALSDQDAALSVQRTLLDARFPAYVVRATTVQGDIYRVRVGAFANRDAALLFSEAMPVVAGGSSPLPALAEGIPAGVMPLEPRVLAQSSGHGLEIVAWRDGVALRVQPEDDRQATYRVFGGQGEPLIFEAWRAQPLEDAVLRLRNLQLWPPSWEDDAPEAREEFRLARLDGVAARLDLAVDQLEPLELRPAYGPPYLIVLELVDLALAADGTIVGIAGVSGPSDRYGPDELAFGAFELPPASEPLYRAGTDDPAAAGALSGDGWSVAADGLFFRLVTEASGDGRGWKAGVGTPLWSAGRYLLARAGNRLYFYAFESR